MALNVSLDVPVPVRQICERLKAGMFEAYVVGGAVRDSLLGKTPKDWDICTNAKPGDVMRVFKDFNVVPTGIEFGTVSVMIDLVPYEITTYRSDGRYSDGRHPDSISFSTSLEEDLKRRDFTVNAIAFDPITGKFVFPEHAQEDLKTETIRAVGNPQERFEEDYLRMVRACRFASKLGFSIESETFEAIKRNAGNITKMSVERVRDELFKMCLATRPSMGIEYLRVTGLLEHIIPELLRGVKCEQPGMYHVYDVYGHNLASMDAVPICSSEHLTIMLRMAGLLHDVAKPSVMAWSDRKQRFTFSGHDIAGAKMSEDILLRLKCSSMFVKQVSRLVGEHMVFVNWLDNNGKATRKAIRRLVARIEADGLTLDNLYAIVRADIIGTGKDIDEGLLGLEKLKEHVVEIGKESGGKVGLTLKDLKVNGRDIMNVLQIPGGPQVGKVLDGLLEKVLDDPSLNEKETLLTLAQSL